MPPLNPAQQAFQQAHAGADPVMVVMFGILALFMLLLASKSIGR